VKELEPVGRVAGLLAEQGGSEEVLAAGIFNPRGHDGAMFAGGFAGDRAGGALGSLGSSVGTAGGALAGARLHDAASGLPEWLVVAVTPTRVVGFDTDARRRPTRLIFGLERSRLDTKVNQRLNVRILELVDRDTGASVQLEGNRVPTLHTGDVLKALRDE
jgi:hypothetical protein